MGAWGTDAFENDTALDFVAIMEEAPDGEGTRAAPGKDALIVMTLMRAADEDDGQDSEAAAEGLAAAEVLAALMGKPSPLMMDPEGPAEALVAWTRNGVTNLRNPKNAVLALKAIERAKTSELADLWDESEQGAEWLAAVEDLKARLS
jgi:hypothetical protein